MIANVSHEHKFVFLAMPRTGSRVTYKKLHDLYGCEPGGNNGGMSHAMRIPEECKDYLAVATCRNPFERWVSYWSLVKQWYPREDEPYKSLIQHTTDHPDDFVGYTRLAVRAQVCQTIASQLERASPKRLALLRFERLQEMFDQLPFLDGRKDNKLRLIHRPETAVWRSWYDDETEHLVAGALKEDFDRFGYPRTVEGWRV